MNKKYRNIITKIPSIHKLARLIMYNNGKIFFRKLYKKNQYDELFRKLHNSCAGKRCFIVGNGPSLRVSDLELLKYEDCFGANEIHRIFSKTSWRPKYYIIVDRYTKTTPVEIAEVDSQIVFLSDYYWRFNRVLREDAICLKQRYFFEDSFPLFSDDISKYIYVGETVTYAALQIAVYLGYTEIYLIGVDHNYCKMLDQKGKLVSDGVKRNHFFIDEEPEDIIANVYGMEKAYLAASEFCKKKGVEIYNASRGGKLEVFKRVELEKVLNI